MGMPVTEDGVQEGGNLNLAAPQRPPRDDRGAGRAGLLEGAGVRDLERRRGSAHQQLVDAPNYTVSAFLPEGIFAG